MALGTLSDLVFHVREISSGHPELLSVRLERRETLSAADFLRSVHSLALALEAGGLEKGDRVAIFSENRPEWHVADFACQLLGVATVPIFPALPRRQVGFILRNSGSRSVFYSDAGKHDLLRELEPTLTSPPALVAFDAAAAAPGGTSITRLMGEGAARLGEVPIERFRGRVKGEDPASLIYTAGAAAEPKAVMLSHRDLISNMLACGEIVDLSRADLALSFLPLSQGFQRTVDHLCFHRGVAIHYVPAIEDVPDAVRRERPTVLVATPEVYGQVRRRTLERNGDQSPLRRRLFRWAMDAGRRHVEARKRGFVGPLLALQRKLAEWLVFRRVHERFGGRLRLAISGGAALEADVSEFFETLGMPLLPGDRLAEQIEEPRSAESSGQPQTQ